MDIRIIGAPDYALREIQEHWHTEERIIWIKCGVDPNGRLMIKYKIPGSDGTATYTTDYRGENIMDKTAYWSIVEQDITRAMETMFPYGAGNTTHHRVEHHLNHVAQVAFREGQFYALASLMTVEDVAEKFQISTRRVRAIARNRQTRFGNIGWQVPGTNQWLFRPEELEQLRPDERHRVK